MLEAVRSPVMTAHSLRTTTPRRQLRFHVQLGGLGGGRRDGAGMFGLSKRAVHRTLHDLQVAGMVKLVVSKRGTAVDLVAH